jgi:hypothetical protein
MGSAESDGRLVRPLDEPERDRVEYDWSAVHQAALTNRVEMIQQIQAVKRHQDKLARLEAYRSSGAAHLQLLLAREEKLLGNLKLEISHQVADAIRDVDLKYGLMQTNHNQAVAADAELVAVKASYHSGIASLDLLLDAMRRSVEASRAYNSARADYARAVSNVEFRKGALLTRYGLKIAN